MIRSWRIAAVALGAAVVGAVALAAPAAAADVTVTPSEAPRGNSAELAFQLPEERTGAYTTKVELAAPEATPIAEIYPLSVDSWAPTATTRKLDQPVELIHGTRTTEVASTITWTRVGEAPAGPAQPVVLTVALGPMPQADRIAFTLIQTYSDGTVVRWADQPDHRAPTVTLVDQGPVAGHDHGGGDAGAAAPVAQEKKSDGMYGILGAGLLLGLAAGLGLDGWLILRAVRRGPAAPAATP